MKLNRSKKGFTLVELVIVIAVIGILSAVLVPTFGDVVKNAKQTSAKSAASNAITNFLVDYAEDGFAQTDIYCIVSGDYYYVLTENGSLPEEGVEGTMTFTAGNEATDKHYEVVAKYNGCTLYLTKATPNGNDNTATCKQGTVTPKSSS